MSKLLLVWSCGLVLVLDVRLASFADAFTVVPTVPTLSSISLSKSSQLFMGKGFHGAKQKQAEMMRKMQLAKQQKQQQQQQPQPPQQKDTEPGDAVSTTTEERISSSSSDPDKTKEFEALLAANLAKQPASGLPSARERRAPPPEVDFWKTPKSDSLQQLSSSSSSTPATNKVKARRKKQRKQKQQAAAAAAAATEGDQSYSLPIGVGQKAHRHDFDALLSATTRQPMGPMTASQLVPWVPPYLQEALVVVVDPRRRSGDWRLAVQQLLLLPPPTGDRGSGGEDGNGRSRVGVCAISADPVDETASWLTRMIQDNGSDTITDDRRPAQPPPPPRVFCDPQLEWMTRYSVVATATAVPASTSSQTMMDDSQDTAAIMDVPASSSSSSSSSVASYRWSTCVLVFDSDGILTELYRGLEDASQTCRQVNEILDRFE